MKLLHIIEKNMEKLLINVNQIYKINQILIKLMKYLKN